MPSGSASSRSDVPWPSAWILGGFLSYIRRSVRRHFHTFATCQSSLATVRMAGLSPETPLVVYGNHASWWDPIVAHLTRLFCFPDRTFFAPIDADALEQYQVFKKLGFYGVRLQSSSGAAAFLRTSQAILRERNTSLWITPEGRFCDPRDTSTSLMPGLPHLAHKLERGILVPLAIEYPFWDERLPMILTRFGPPIDVRDHANREKFAWQELLASSLRATQEELAKQVIARDSAPFESLLSGSAGVGSIYGFFRSFHSRLRGRRVPQQHGDQFRR